MTELQFPFDLIYRTKSNLMNYSGQYEITNLLNSALGLIVLPYERIIKQKQKTRNCTNTQGTTISKWWDKKVSKISELSFLEHKVGYSNYNQPLSITVEKVRHGLAHQNIEFVNKDNKIEKIIIWNCPLGNRPKDLEIEFEIEELGKFVLYIANSYINAYMNDLVTNWKKITDPEERKKFEEQADKSFDREDYAKFRTLISK